MSGRIILFSSIQNNQNNNIDVKIKYRVQNILKRTQFPVKICLFSLTKTVTFEKMILKSFKVSDFTKKILI